MRASLMVTALALLSAGCGGGGGGSAAPCSFTGTWDVYGTIDSYYGAYCKGSGAVTGTLTVSGTDPRSYTVTGENGTVFLATFDPANCTAALTASNGGIPSGATWSETNTVTWDLAFQGNSLSGTGVIGITTSPQQAGTPCSVDLTLSGTRQ